MSKETKVVNISEKRVEEVNMWKVGDKAMWEGGLFEIRAIEDGPWPEASYAWLRGIEATTFLETAPLHELTRPAPRKRTVLVREFRHEDGTTQWAEKNPHHTYTVTGRTHEFQIEEDADGNQG